MEHNVSSLHLALYYNSSADAYLRRHRRERFLPVSYVPPDSYLQRFHKERRDTTKFTPWATVKKFPRQGNEFLYGWTYRHKDGAVRIREDLFGEKKMETDLHECGHTPDERETRYRTSLKMEAMFPQEEKYKTKPEEYVR